MEDSLTIIQSFLYNWFPDPIPVLPFARYQSSSHFSVFSLTCMIPPPPFMWYFNHVSSSQCFSIRCNPIHFFSWSPIQHPTLFNCLLLPFHFHIFFPSPLLNTSQSFYFFQSLFPISPSPLSSISSFVILLFLFILLVAIHSDMYILLLFTGINLRCWKSPLAGNTLPRHCPASHTSNKCPLPRASWVSACTIHISLLRHTCLVWCWKCKIKGWVMTKLIRISGKGNKHWIIIYRTRQQQRMQNRKTGYMAAAQTKWKQGLPSPPYLHEGNEVRENILVSKHIY